MSIQNRQIHRHCRRFAVALETPRRCRQIQRTDPYPASSRRLSVLTREKSNQTPPRLLSAPRHPRTSLPRPPRTQTPPYSPHASRSTLSRNRSNASFVNRPSPTTAAVPNPPNDSFSASSFVVRAFPLFNNRRAASTNSPSFVNAIKSNSPPPVVVVVVVVVVVGVVAVRHASPAS